MQAEGHSAVADLGGSIITGIDGNPLAVLAAQLNIPLHDINTSGVPLYLEDGTEADTRIDAKVSATTYENPAREAVHACPTVKLSQALSELQSGMPTCR